MMSKTVDDFDARSIYFGCKNIGEVELLTMF